jgi:nicotinate-nucleotide pyrophosphorylase (carboxylating)
MGERTALNFLSRLSGIASTTAEMADAVKKYGTNIVCTRKTTPGHRILEKYAVRVGGGVNHRFGLDDAMLIKDNHVIAAGGVKPAVQKARAHAGHLVKIEVEVDTLDQLDEILALHPKGADVVMLDNFSPDTIREAVRRIDGRLLIEVSGGVTLENVSELAAAGANLISSGALTHSVNALDIGLDFA